MIEIPANRFVAPETYDVDAYWRGKELARAGFEGLRLITDQTFFYPAMNVAKGIVEVHALTPHFPKSVRTEVARTKFRGAMHILSLMPPEDSFNPEVDPRIAMATYLARVDAGIACAYDSIFNPSRTPIRAGSRTDWETDRRGLEDFRKLLLSA